MTERFTVRFEPGELQRIKRVARQLRITDEHGPRTATASDFIRMAAVEYATRVATEPLFSDPIGVGDA